MGNYSCRHTVLSIVLLYWYSGSTVLKPVGDAKEIIVADYRLYRQSIPVGSIPEDDISVVWTGVIDLDTHQSRIDLLDLPNDVLMFSDYPLYLGDGRQLFAREIVVSVVIDRVIDPSSHNLGLAFNEQDPDTGNKRKDR